jgi:hypothetical protein
MRAGHNAVCWRHHPECALARARDLEATRRDHAAGRARLFADAAARALRLNALQRHQELGEVIAAARSALEAERATFRNNAGRQVS